ncbi:MAG TPA: hypothetical protein PKD72_06015, partial [Gemmatales bacterium]|nr:hypothetical protein [Gemmatales bacterium]
GSTTEARLEFLAQKLLCRSFTAEEVKIMEDSLKALVDYYSQQEADARKLITVGDSKPDETLNPGELASWTMLCNQLMNLDEVLNK